MNYSFVFFLNSALLGVGLAMDAFSVSLANGLHEPKMRMKKMCGIAGTFGAFQAIMPMTGWLCVHTIVEYFKAFEILLTYSIRTSDRISIKAFKLEEDLKFE